MKITLGILIGICLYFSLKQFAEAGSSYDLEFENSGEWVSSKSESYYAATTTVDDTSTMLFINSIAGECE